MAQALPPRVSTRVLKVGKDQLGQFRDAPGIERLGTWDVSTDDSASVKVLQEAASYLQSRDLPVGFPTETVYGLGAAATRGASARGIYTAKGRPSDNPLIVHVSDLGMLRGLLAPGKATNNAPDGQKDPIPDIYKPLISRFWPGPLTMLMPVPGSSQLAPEVTAGLGCFGARMPSSPLALSLIKLTGAPLAAPSANASTRPSATTASDVLEDMDGRIEIILDGGSCQVGVESTVVDGLCDPPVVLRPGGVSLAEIRSCPGWEKVEKAYKDRSEVGTEAPRAPGMKYKHYSPRASVILYEPTHAAGERGVSLADAQTMRLIQEQGGDVAIGIIRTRHWRPAAGLKCGPLRSGGSSDAADTEVEVHVQEAELADAALNKAKGKLFDISIGPDAKSAAQGLFSALRELDRRRVDFIFVEGIPDDVDVAAAVMNRLRKAASDIRS